MNAFGRRHQLDAVAFQLGAVQRRARQHHAIVLGDEPRQRAHERLRLEDAGVRRQQRRRDADVRLAFPDLRGVDQLEPLDAVFNPLGSQRFERRNLARVMSDDQLSAAPMRDTVRGAELVNQARALDAMLRLQRAGRVVDARMNHLAVVGARRHARTRLLLEDAHAMAAPRDRQRRRQSHHAAADDGGIDLFHKNSRLIFARTAQEN